MEKKIQFGAWDVLVKLNPDVNGPEGDYGDYDRSTQTVRVGTSVPPAEQVDTLIHELIHLVAVSRYLDVDEKLEERIAQILGTGLAEILLRNPWITKWIDKKRKETEDE